MKIEKIRPIPKYILERIRQMDKKDNVQNGATRYYSYLTKNDGELVKVTVAVKNRHKKWYYKQCAVHGIHSDKCFIKDMVFSRLAGYRVGWYEQGLQKLRNWYEHEDWGWQYDRLFDPYAPIVNEEYLDKFTEYKYSAVELYCYTDIFKYLRLYEEYPQIEYLMKLGFGHYALSKQILRKVGKNKQFKSWLLRHKDKIINNYFNIVSILQSFKTNENLEIIQQCMDIRKKFCYDPNVSCVCKVIKNKDWLKLGEYLNINDVSKSSYADYIKACLALDIDMSMNKNKFPNDFKYWHDVRTREYELKLIELDEEKNKEFYKSFAEVANRYIQLEKQDKDFAIIIAKSPKDLKLEGQALDHCVGRMGYDKKMVDGNSLIFFVRQTNNLDTPLVTVEYSPKQHKVLQCYGYHDTKPKQDILDFVDNKWLPYANKQIRKMQRAFA